MNGEEIAKALTWSDIALLMLLLILAIVIIFYGIRFLNRRDKQTNQLNKTCKIHEWEWKEIGGEKVMKCKKCPKVAGRDPPIFFDKGFDGP